MMTTNSQILHKKDPYHQQLEAFRLDIFDEKTYLSRSELPCGVEWNVYIANNIKYKFTVVINQNGAIYIIHNVQITEQNNKFLSICI